MLFHIFFTAAVYVLRVLNRTSLEDPNAGGFSRDQFGRQSMSEKRHAALDAKNTDTYQRNKKLRSVPRLSGPLRFHKFINIYILKLVIPLIT